MGLRLVNVDRRLSCLLRVEPCPSSITALSQTLVLDFELEEGIQPVSRYELCESGEVSMEAGSHGGITTWVWSCHRKEAFEDFTGSYIDGPLFCGEVVLV